MLPTQLPDGYVDEACDLPDTDGRLTLTEVPTPEDMWMAYEITVPIGTYPEEEATYTTIHFCDFASAGNPWDHTNRYRVWLPQPVDVTKNPR